MTVVDRFDPQRTYDTSAAEYDETSRRYWAFSVRRTVDLTDPRPGDRVLDVACGPGPVALLEAERVGPGGTVVGLDLSEAMLVRARAHAEAAGLTNLELRSGDMHALPFPPRSFDVVSCVFGVFFAHDVVPVLRDLWGLVAPGGRLGVTTLGDDFFAPMFGVFLDAVAAERPGLELPVPWDRTADPDAFLAMLVAAGVHEPSVLREAATLVLDAPDDWWRIARATGIRRWLLELGPEASERVRRANAAWMAANDLAALRLDVNYGLATRPPAASEAGSGSGSVGTVSGAGGSGWSGGVGSAGVTGSAGTAGATGSDGTIGPDGSTGCGTSIGGEMSGTSIRLHYPSGVSPTRSSSSPMEAKTAIAPASRSSCSEKPPVSTAIVRTPALAAASTSHGVSPTITASPPSSRCSAVWTRSGAGLVASTSAAVVHASTSSRASSRSR